MNQEKNNHYPPKARDAPSPPLHVEGHRSLAGLG
jgi:hypothetical protein